MTSNIVWLTPDGWVIQYGAGCRMCPHMTGFGPEATAEEVKAAFRFVDRIRDTKSILDI